MDSVFEYCHVVFIICDDPRSTSECIHMLLHWPDTVVRLHQHPRKPDLDNLKTWNTTHNKYKDLLYRQTSIWMDRQISKENQTNKLLVKYDRCSISEWTRPKPSVETRPHSLELLLTLNLSHFRIVLILELIFLRCIQFIFCDSKPCSLLLVMPVICRTVGSSCGRFIRYFWTSSLLGWRIHTGRPGC